MSLIDNLKKALETGNADEFEQLVKSHDANAVATSADSRFSRTALHWAARYNRQAEIHTLIELGADINAPDISKNTPLHIAAMNGSPEAVQMLVLRGANLDARNLTEATPYIFAAGQASKGASFGACAQLLASGGANVKAVDKDGVGAVAHAQEIVTANKSMQASTLGAPQNANDISRAAIADPNLAKAISGLDQMAAQAKEIRAEMNPFPPQPEQPKEALAQGDAQPGAPMTKEQALQKLEELGFQRLGAIEDEPKMEGRNALVSETSTLLDKRKNVMLCGKAGVGKRSIARACAESLASRGKIMLSVPSSSFRGDKYAGSVNANIQRWLEPALSLGDDLVLFINDAHQLSTGRTSSDTTDTPLQILREQMDSRKDKRLNLLCATTPKEIASLEADDAFMSLFSRTAVEPMTAAEALSAMMSPAGAQELLREHPEATVADLSSMASLCVDLCDKYLFNQSFPAKAFEFASRALAQGAPSTWNEQALTNLFGQSYSVPKEIVEGRMNADSPFYKLEAGLGEIILGQEGPLSEIAKAVASKVVLANPNSHRPLTMLFGGPTGVGKTEASESMGRILSLPVLKLNMGEVKTAQDVEKFKADMEAFCSKNYAGIVLVDEIEKGHSASRDILLSLFEKGTIGSGESMVKCGFMICIATTNVGAKASVEIKKELRSAYGNPKIHDSWLRGQMIQAGFRPEFMNRIDVAIDYNDITTEHALSIAKLMFASKAKELASTRKITLKIDESLALSHAAEIFDPEYGARGIRRCVEDTLNAIVSERSIALAVGPSSVLSARSICGSIHADVIPLGGEKVSVVIQSASANDELARLNAVLGKFGALVDGARESASRPLPSTPQPLMPSA